MLRQHKKRYKCNNCSCNYSEGDSRLKHGMEKCIKVIKMYFEGTGIHVLLKDQKRSSPLIIYAYDIYSKYKILPQHSTSKAKTSLVESKNSLIRHYLASFNRRSKRYFKAFDMIENSLILLFFKNLLSILIQQHLIVNFLTIYQL